MNIELRANRCIIPRGLQPSFKLEMITNNYRQNVYLEMTDITRPYLNKDKTHYPYIIYTFRFYSTKLATMTNVILMILTLNISIFLYNNNHMNCWFNYTFLLIFSIGLISNYINSHISIIVTITFEPYNWKFKL